MAKFPAELVIDREPLWGAPQAGGLESRSEDIVIERSKSHQTGGSFRYRAARGK
jgi:hypothetical protein